MEVSVAELEVVDCLINSSCSDLYTRKFRWEDEEEVSFLNLGPFKLALLLNKD